MARRWANVDEELKARHAEPLLKGASPTGSTLGYYPTSAVPTSPLFDRGNPPHLPPKWSEGVRAANGEYLLLAPSGSQLPPRDTSAVRREADVPEPTHPTTAKHRVRGYK